MYTKEQETVLADMQRMTQVLQSTGYFEMVKHYKQWILLRKNLFRIRNNGITLEQMRTVVNELKKARPPKDGHVNVIMHPDTAAKLREDLNALAPDEDVPVQMGVPL